MAEHIWGGGYEIITEAAYYAKHIAAAEREGRVGNFPPVPDENVYTSWDLGVDDYTAIWFIQILQFPLRVRIVDYYECDSMGPDEILPEALPEYTKDEADQRAKLVEIGRPFAFQYQRHFFPHDIGMREWGAGAKTRVQTVNSLGVPLEKINRGVAQNPEERINATRRILPICEFHQTKRVMVGLSRVRRYSRKFNEHLGTYLGPLKDGNDHGADALGEFAINCGI
jgi:phage terminase large subunit